MTKEEENRAYKRRTQNREAAQRFRQRQKDEVDRLMKVGSKELTFLRTSYVFLLIIVFIFYFYVGIHLFSVLFSSFLLSVSLTIFFLSFFHSLSLEYGGAWHRLVVIGCLGFLLATMGFFLLLFFSACAICLQDQLLDSYIIRCWLSVKQQIENFLSLCFSREHFVLWLCLQKEIEGWPAVPIIFPSSEPVVTQILVLCLFSLLF